MEDFDDILKYIASADSYELNEIIDAIVRRYSIVFPDWEVMFLSITKDPWKRPRQKRQLISMMKRCL